MTDERIEQIKQRLAKNLTPFDTYHNYRYDVAYLVSRLEAAEKTGTGTGEKP